MRHSPEVAAGTFGFESTPLRDAAFVVLYSLISVDEGLSLIFIHELYLCTYKMEIRQQKLVSLLKKALLAFVVVGVAAGVDEGTVIQNLF